MIRMDDPAFFCRFTEKSATMSQIYEPYILICQSSSLYLYKGNFILIPSIEYSQETLFKKL